MNGGTHMKMVADVPDTVYVNEHIHHKSWKELDLKCDKEILKCLKSLKFTHATAVQEATIPHFLGHKDVAVEAITGSGKTLCFVVPILNKLLNLPVPLKALEVGAVVIAPTRELAVQINGVFDSFMKNFPNITKFLLIGGTDTNEDISNILKSGCNIIVATPGKLEDLFNRRSPQFSLPALVKSLEVLVLDEADKLLDLKFEKTLNAILSFLPKQRRTGLFSATMTKEVEDLARAGLRNPIWIRVKSSQDQTTPSNLENYYVICPTQDKFSALVGFISMKAKITENMKAILFFSTCACVDYFGLLLQHFIKGIEILSLHGKMKQKRFKVFDKFRDLPSGLLLCTDIMARGIDIPEVHWVIQYDPPSSAAAFVHRCGRTARIGRRGASIIFLLENERPYVEFLSINQKVELSEYPDTWTPELVLDKTRELLIKDRSCLDKSNRAFVSFCQSYSKHECKLLFRLQDLNMGKLAKAFGLLQMPKMPELKNITILPEDFTPVNIDLNTIPYRDKSRELVRQGRLKEFQDTGKWPRKKGDKRRQLPSTVPWSRQKEKKTKKLKNREKKKKRKLSHSDVQELAQDIALMKKLKRKKITTEQFDEQFLEVKPESTIDEDA